MAITLWATAGFAKTLLSFLADDALGRSGHSVQRIEIEVDALSIRQSSLDLPSQVIGEHLIAAGFDRTQHLSNYVYRFDLRKGESAPHIRIDQTGMHAHHLRTLPA